MKVRIVCYEDLDLWILGKFARKLQEQLTLLGVQCDIAKVPDLTANINHHIIYYDYNGMRSTIDTVMITHIDTDRKLQLIRKQLEVAELGICFSSDTVNKLASQGIPKEKLCYVLPAHDQVMKPRKLVIGLTSKVHNDLRKREYLLPQLAEHISTNDFMFKIMGMGWENIVTDLREKGFEVEYFNNFDYELNVRLVPTFDYYLYFGLDEGAMGFIDALAAGIPTIVTPQGYHLDAKNGITHPFVNLEELIAIFYEIAEKRNKLIDSVRTWTWPDFAVKHLELWQYLIADRNSKLISQCRYQDGLNSVTPHSSFPDILVNAQVDQFQYQSLQHPLTFDSENKNMHTDIAVREIPPQLYDKFTLNGCVAVEHWYLNDVSQSDEPLYFAASQIRQCQESIRRHESGSYGPTNLWLYEALDKYSISGKSVVIMGSEAPWYEAMVLEYGGYPTTIEYRKITSDFPGIQFYTPDEFAQNPRQFDSALSISSFEHDGLGRYGDPIDPEGDLVAMRKMKRILKPGGLLFLALPVGKDIIVWNAHRVYGRYRLPLLLQGWKLVDSFGFSDELLNHDTIGGGEFRNYIQPVFVLQNMAGETPKDSLSSVPANSSLQLLLEGVRALLAKENYEEAGNKLRSLLQLYPKNAEAIALERMMKLISLKALHSRK